MKITVKDAAIKLNKKEVVAIPTETVYGLAASITHEEAIKKIFSLKNRPLTNPLIIHISHISQLKDFLEPLSEEVQKLMDKFWPGSLTFILPLSKNAQISSLITANLPTVAVRMPNQKDTLELINMIGPIVAPSANRSGYPSSTLISHVEQDFGDSFPVLNSETICAGLESTIIAYEDGIWKIAREGAILASDLGEILGYRPLSLSKKEKPICPGQHFRHYAPNAKLILKSYEELQNLEGVIVGFTERNYHKATQLIYLGSLSNSLDLQTNLYKTLRFLDEKGISTAYVDIDFPSDDRSQILKHRMEKAASC